MQAALERHDAILRAVAHGLGGYIFSTGAWSDPGSDRLARPGLVWLNVVASTELSQRLSPGADRDVRPAERPRQRLGGPHPAQDRAGSAQSSAAEGQAVVKRPRGT